VASVSPIPDQGEHSWQLKPRANWPTKWTSLKDEALDAELSREEVIQKIKEMRDVVEDEATGEEGEDDSCAEDEDDLDSEEEDDED
jgi:hypothetical protein